MNLEYVLHLKVYERGFYKDITSPVPLFIGMTVTVDLPGPTIYCIIEDINVSVSDKVYGATIYLIPKEIAEQGPFPWVYEAQEHIVKCLGEQGWTE